MRKVYGVIKALDDLVKKSDGHFLVGKELTIADIAAGSMLGMINMVETDWKLIEWKEKYPRVRAYWEGLEKRKSFEETKPIMFNLTEKIA